MSTLYFEQRLQLFSPRPIKVLLNTNRSVYLRVIQTRPFIQLSLHRFFLNCSDEVCKAIISYSLKKDPKACKILRVFSHLAYEKESEKRMDPKKLITEGNVFDLKEVFSQVNQQYFENQLTLDITWFKKPKYKRFRSITYGSYQKKCRLIRINQILDHPKVPRYFMEYLIYHEALHDLVPAFVDEKGSIRTHNKEFHQKEKKFLFYQQAKEWEMNFKKQGFKYGRT